MQQLINAGKFTLQYQPDTDSLTHGKLLKVQYGGLKGLAKLLQTEDMDAGQLLSDINHLVRQVRQHWGNYDAVPYEQILQDISTHQNRKRRSRK